MTQGITGPDELRDAAVLSAEQNDAPSQVSRALVSKAEASAVITFGDVVGVPNGGVSVIRGKGIVLSGAYHGSVLKLVGANNAVCLAPRCIPRWPLSGVLDDSASWVLLALLWCS